MRCGAIRFWVPRRLKLQTQYSSLIAEREKKSVTLATDTQLKKKKKSYPCYQEIVDVIVHMAQKLNITNISLESKGDFKCMELRLYL